jgi:hypothetical protein
MKVSGIYRVDVNLKLNGVINPNIPNKFMGIFIEVPTSDQLVEAVIYKGESVGFKENQLNNLIRFVELAKGLNLSKGFENESGSISVLYDYIFKP